MHDEVTIPVSNITAHRAANHVKPQDTMHAYSMRARPANAMAPAPAALPLLAAPVYCQTGAELVGDTGA